MAAGLHQCRRETERTLEYAEAAITLSTEQGFPLWLAWATILRGWALAQQGRAEEGIAQMREGLIAYRATGAELARPYQLALLAQACGNAGQAETGLEKLGEALNVADRKGERYYVAELHRLRGELLQQRSGAQSRYLADHEAAQACFRDAIAIARQQGARSLELRTASSLARLCQREANVGAARQTLAAIHGAFAEGFDTADRQELFVYMFSGFCAAIVGLVITAQLQTAHPLTGQTFELNAIAAVVLGGTALMGGRGTVFGSVVGACVISILGDGMVMCGISDFWQMVIKGLVIIFAVVVDQLQQRLQTRMVSLTA
ncbi:ABC transporter permease [Paraburkholderia franconis]|uniref:ABC transporter permease n=1 Tax=Paraburkholderia franconis TaxID=2654983 RepID=UPI001D11A0D5|nr:hypothetical protein [Paraburkholderia franconis]